MNSFNERFMKSVGRHFVTLSCVHTPAGSRDEKIHVFSGFVVAARGVWFYVTAGHILRQVRTSLGRGGKFDVWRLGDQQSAGNKFRDTAIPYSFAIEHWTVIEDEDTGLDYAAVPLQNWYQMALKAGDVVPIDRRAWGDHVTEHDQWALVGVPSETVSYDGKTIIKARVVVAPLEQVDPPVKDAKVANRFFGRLKDDSAGVVKDIDGMSGGPIFALKKIQEEWKYKVIGVQSAWYPQRRIIAACPFSSLGRELERVVLVAKIRWFFERIRAAFKWGR